MTTPILNFIELVDNDPAKFQQHDLSLRQIEAYCAGIAIALVDAPTSSDIGNSFLVSSTPSGDFVSNPNEIAIRDTDSTWQFYPPILGVRVYDISLGLERQWSGTEWSLILPGSLLNSSITSTTFTASPGNRYLVDGTETLTLPTANNFDIVEIVDSGNTFQNLPLTILPTGTDTIKLETELILDCNRDFIRLVFFNGDWVEVSRRVKRMQSPYTVTFEVLTSDFGVTLDENNTVALDPDGTARSVFLPDMPTNSLFFVIVNDSDNLSANGNTLNIFDSFGGLLLATLDDTTGNRAARLVYSEDAARWIVWHNN